MPTLHAADRLLSAGFGLDPVHRKVFVLALAGYRLSRVALGLECAHAEDDPEHAQRDVAQYSEHAGKHMEERSRELEDARLAHRLPQLPPCAGAEGLALPAYMSQRIDKNGRSCGMDWVFYDLKDDHIRATILVEERTIQHAPLLQTFAFRRLC